MRVLQYLVLCKVLNEAAGEVAALLGSKMALKHAGPPLEAMAAIAKAARARSLEDFKAAVGRFSAQLTEDELIAHHLDLLYDKMLEANLLKIISPYRLVWQQPRDDSDWEREREDSLELVRGGGGRGGRFLLFLMSPSIMCL